MKQLRSLKSIVSLVLLGAVLCLSPWAVLAEMLNNASPSETAVPVSVVEPVRQGAEIVDSAAAELPAPPAPSEAGLEQPPAPSEVVPAPVPSAAPTEVAALTFEFYVEGELFNTQVIKHGEALYDPGQPVKEGFSFTGWYIPAENNAALLLLQPIPVHTTATVIVVAAFVEDEVPPTPETAAPETEPAPTEPAATEAVSPEVDSQPSSTATTAAPTASENSASTTAKVQRSVSITTTQKAVVEKDELITLSAVLTGFEDVAVKLQWQFNDGFAWQDVPNATALEYEFAANAANVNYEWRLKVVIVTGDKK